MRAQPLDKSLQKHCGESAPDLSLTVAADGALQEAVVSIDDAVPDLLPSNLPQPFIDQKACLYRPTVLSTRAGQMLKVKNSDPLMHNVRAMSSKSPVFNVAMPLEGLTLDKPLPAAAGITQLHCDVHPWMTAWVVTFAHNLYATTTPDGRFRIDGVPAGKHPVKVWHPRLGQKMIEVAVQADAGTPVEVEWEVSDTVKP